MEWFRAKHVRSLLQRHDLGTNVHRCRITETWPNVCWRTPSIEIKTKLMHSGHRSIALPHKITGITVYTKTLTSSWFRRNVFLFFFWVHGTRSDGRRYSFRLLHIRSFFECTVDACARGCRRWCCLFFPSRFACFRVEKVELIRSRFRLSPYPRSLCKITHWISSEIWL